MTIFKIFFATVLSLNFAVSPLLSSSVNASTTHDTTVVAKQSASIMLIDPPVATMNVISIAVRGLDWGPYKERQNPQAWLVDPVSDALYPLTVSRNYNDCSLALVVRDECSNDQIFLRLEIPEDTKSKLTAKTYGLYIVTENLISALGQFTIIDNPLSKDIIAPTLAIAPMKGPVKTYAMLFGAGFSKEGLNVRFDGVKISVGGYFSPQNDGTFENVGITVPSTLVKDNKIIPVLPGEHTISISNDNPAHPVSATATFVVQEKVEYETKKQNKKEFEQIEKDRKLQEQIDKEQEKLKKDQKKIEEEKITNEKEKTDLQKKIDEQKKLKRDQKLLQKKLDKQEKIRKEQDKKLSDIDKKQELLNKKEEKIKTKFCDAELPLTFQPDCIQLKKEITKSPYEGRPCSADTAITFQPGCIGQQPETQRKLFASKSCSNDIPLVWQEGCIQQPRQEVKGEYEGKICDISKAITFQPGCISPVRKESELQSSKGQKCDSLIPDYSQVGCIK